MTELDTTMDELDQAFEDVAEDAVVDEEVDEEVDTDAEDEDFEYDDDGNIIIPEGDEEAKADDADDGEGSKPDDAKADDAEQKDEEKEQLKAEVSRIKAQAKATLEKLGVKIENDDVFGGLVKLAAEADDTTPEEYLKKQEEDAKAGEALRRADLEELHRLFPETAQYDDVSKLPHYKEFAQKRMSGANAEKAYKETHVDEIVAHAVSNANKNSLKGTKDHLRSTVPVGAKDDAITMNKKELAEMREIFPDMKDKEIVALYRKTKGL